ncbi:UNKNOWN [Stylonychia lemnae]|uniref:Uncharacterized protein n=1 Tax=Stylonychia lemnae TaxID=5949 RepID=A0A078A9V4_STYLE|nr:UNKNOWN [Stylonychia lemnae]|eukprot:CDW78676.1 UNKNOWN [Stylonychia lemnae]
MTYYSEHFFWQQRVNKELNAHRRVFDHRVGLSGVSSPKSSNFRSFAGEEDQSAAQEFPLSKKLCQSKQVKTQYMPRNKQIYTFGGTINVRDIFERPTFENEDLVANNGKQSKMAELIDIKSIKAGSQRSRKINSMIQSINGTSSHKMLEVNSQPIYFGVNDDRNKQSKVMNDFMISRGSNYNKYQKIHHHHYAHLLSPKTKVLQPFSELDAAADTVNNPNQNAPQMRPMTTQRAFNFSNTMRNSNTSSKNQLLSPKGERQQPEFVKRVLSSRQQKIRKSLNTMLQRDSKSDLKEVTANGEIKALRSPVNQQIPEEEYSQEKIINNYFETERQNIKSQGSNQYLVGLGGTFDQRIGGNQNADLEEYIWNEQSNYVNNNKMIYINDDVISRGTRGTKISQLEKELERERSMRYQLEQEVEKIKKIQQETLSQVASRR